MKTFLLTLAAMIVFGAPVMSWAQPEAPVQPADAPESSPIIPESNVGATSVDAPSVEALLAEVAASDLPEETKAQATALLKQASDDLARAGELQARTKQHQADKLNVPDDRLSLTQKLEALQAEDPQQPDPELPLSELETQLSEKQHQLAEAIAQLDAYVADLKSRPAKRETLRNNLFAQPKELAETQQQIQMPPPEGAPPLLTQAVRAQLLARENRLKFVPDAMQAELSLYDAKDAHDIPRLRRDLLERTVAAHKQEVQNWEQLVKHKREDAISRRIDAARHASETASEATEDLFQGNVEIARNEREIRSQTTRIVDEAEQTRVQTAALQQRYEQLTDREQKVAGSTAFGLRLRQERAELLDPEALRRAVESRLQTVEEARLDALDYSDQLELLADIERAVETHLSEMPPEAAVSELADDEIRYGLEQRKEFLSELVKAYNDYTDALDNLEREQLSLAALTETVTSYIDERVMWIRSHRSVSLTGLVQERDVLLWLVSGEWGSECLNVLKTDVWHRPGWYAMFLVVIAILQLVRRRQRRRLDKLATTVASRSNVEIGPTVRAAFISLWMAVLWPTILLFFAWRLAAAAEATEFTRILGADLMQASAVLLLLEFTRQLVRVDGLAESHFQWGERVRARLSSWVRWLTAFGFPLMLVVAVLNSREGNSGGDVYERIGFALTLMLLAWALRDLMHPRTGVLLEWISYRPGGWLDRLRPVWAMLALAVPLALAGLSLYGYHYTSQRLAEKLVFTLVLVEAAVIIRCVIFRWLKLRHRRLAIEQARARRAALAESATMSGFEESVARIVDSTEQKADLSHSSTQSQRLVNTSLSVLALALTWFIWADVLPALNYLNSLTIWPRYQTLVESTPLTTPPIGPEMEVAESAPAELSAKVGGVTLADLIQAIVVVVLTFTAGRNLPGLLEIAVLERLPIDASVRYAVTIFARYGIVVLGVLLVSRLLGLDWSSVQWLAAAFTFGLAFGLQEIFANFVSGIIILFEQPLRVGDVVTIDNVTGAVSRIRMRSTTITDWDRKEYIVPNKEFITGRLLNWTLTDALNRVTIPVGVSYDSDPEQVRRIILEIAKAHESVLEDPPPVAVFDGFGNSALNFTLRFFLPDLSHRLETIHELHTRILQRFRSEGIEIPFPQQDLHVRSVPKALAKAIASDPEADDRAA
jgi:potassium efflux system protein